MEFKLTSDYQPYRLISPKRSKASPRRSKLRWSQVLLGELTGSGKTFYCANVNPAGAKNQRYPKSWIRPLAAQLLGFSSNFSRGIAVESVFLITTTISRRHYPQALELTSKKISRSRRRFEKLRLMPLPPLLTGKGMWSSSSLLFPDLWYRILRVLPRIHTVQVEIRIPRKSVAFSNLVVLLLQ